jgi:hypothetical protein
MIAIGTTACSDSTSPPQNAQLRFAHAAVGTDAVNFRVEEADVRTDVAYGDDVSAYGAVPAGSRKLAARLTDGTTDLASATEAFQSGSQYTAVLVKGSSGEEIVVFADTSTAAAEGKTRLRIINAAPAAEAVDVYVTDADADLEDATAALTEVEPAAASKYVEVTSGAQRIRFTTAGTKTVVLDIDSIDLPDGGVRTVLLLEAEEGGTPFQSIVAEDRG